MTAFELEKEALALPDAERAQLITRLLESFPGVLSDPDEGIAEAMRRDAELRARHSVAISLDQLMASLKP